MTHDDTRDMLAYIDASPTPWHCVATSAARLDAAGFVRLDESGAWGTTTSDAASAGFYLVRDGALVAWRLGRQAPWDAGVRVIGAHTDSPGLRVKPVPDVTRAGFRQLGVEVYGGALWYTWLDRDLGLAGRVYLHTDASDGVPTMRLVTMRRALARVPSLAIHLQREVNTDGLKLNPQQHLPPVWAMEATDTRLTAVLAAELGVEAGAIAAWDLCFFDITPPTLGGLDDAFVFAPRLDNQASCHAALTALERAGTAERTQVVALYDHEEVGSQTTAGAEGPLLENVLRRIAGLPHWSGPGDTAPAANDGAAVERFARAMAKSWLVSADMAHGAHPNFEDKHEPQHKPSLNGGPVIKVNHNQRYATTGEGVALFQAVCAAAGVPVQLFVTRTDLACGTTIGPIAAARLGIRTVDVGNPMLSMHSVREQCGSQDQPRMIQAMTRFFAS